MICGYAHKSLHKKKKVETVLTLEQTTPNQTLVFFFGSLLPLLGVTGVQGRLFVLCFEIQCVSFFFCGFLCVMWKHHMNFVSRARLKSVVVGGRVAVLDLIVLAKRGFMPWLFSWYAAFLFG